MIKCKACGFEAERLQWTHFKYNCVGKYKNGREYQVDYPNAPIVSPELAKRTAVTKETLISKYGEQEGLEKWNQYCEKQRVKNTFEHKASKHGWTKEEFDAYNKSRAVTVDTLVAKYGEVDGLEKWAQYCEKQRETKSKEYVIEKYGMSHWETLCQSKKKSTDPNYQAVKLGITVEEAVYLIQNRGLKYTSYLEVEFVTLLEKTLGESLENSGLTRQFGKMTENGYVFFDVKHKDVIIEFNGDYWHANPKFYTSDDYIRGVSVIEIWGKDKKKQEIAEQNGFRFLTVWESEFKADKQQTVRKVIEWILNGRE